MKMRVLFLLALILLLTNSVLADEIQASAQTNPITQPQNIAFEDCTKMFAVNKEKLFYLTLASITANKFTIDEIQTSNGYIIFSQANNKYLATIAGIDGMNSILRITPCNNIYIFPPGILLGIYKYVELNLNTEIK